MTQATTGVWDLSQRPLLFLAGAKNESLPWTRPRLVAFDRLAREGDPYDASRTRGDPYVAQAFDGCPVMLDSGVFAYAQRFARAEGLRFDQVRRRDPSTLPFFDWHRATYLDMCRDLETAMWGAVEIDFGDADAKTATRAWFEGHGVTPMPVFSAPSDPLDYFDQLVDGYDRVCLGSVAGAGRELAPYVLGLHERCRRRGVEPWLHILGRVASLRNLQIPWDSVDHSNWLAAPRYADCTVNRMVWPQQLLGQPTVVPRDNHRKFYANVMRVSIEEADSERAAHLDHTRSQLRLTGEPL